MRNRHWTVVCIAFALVFAFGVTPEAFAQCACPFQGDMSDDGYVDAIDDGYLIEHLFFGHPGILQDPTCPTTRGDLNADGIHDLADLLMFYAYAFEGEPPVDPCSCGFPCAQQTGSGTGSVVVESKTVRPNSQHTIGIYISNSTAIDGVVIPLVIRAIDAYPSTLQLREHPSGRFAPGYAIEITTYLDLMNGDCAGGPGTGFSDPDYSGEPTEVSSPDAFQYVRSNIAGFYAPMAAATDMTPSLEIVFTAPDSLGSFEVDTTCSTPTNHLAFFEADTYGEITPDFTRGVITVDCDCPFQGDLDMDSFRDAVDLGLAIDVLFFGADDIQDSLCPATRTDFNADGFPDAADLNLLIDHMFFNGPLPTDPCNSI